MSTFTLDRLIAELQDLRQHCDGETPVVVELDGSDGKTRLADACSAGFVYVIPSGASIRTGYRVPVNAADERGSKRIQAVVIH